jgi:hypothetical protein
MAAMKSRISRIERQFSETRKGPVEFAVIYVGAPDAAEREQRAVSEYHARYGCLDGLRIIHTRVPEPKPLPEAFKLKSGKPCTRIGEE